MTNSSWSYPPRLDLAQLPTPLQPLDRFTSRIQEQNPKAPRLWVKRDDLTGCVESGNKIRKLEFLFAEAQAQQASVVITCGGVQSNHCRATAVLAARLGMQCHLILRGELPEGSTPSGNLLLDQFCGAEVSLYKKSYFHQNIDSLFSHYREHYVQQGNTVMCIPTGGSNGIGVWGYIAACEELKSDFAQYQLANTAILTASGSGGTQAGLIAGSVLHQLDAKVFGINVCDDESYFVNKIKHDLSEWCERYDADAGTLLDVAKNATPVILDGYVGAGYAKAGPEIYQLIKTLASLEGLVLDPVYTGKAFYGLQDKLLGGYFNSFENLVFVHTGGVFGLLADESRAEF